ncbi:hypothetical protein VTP01DRAFT_5617 [Rhizomucor pusillus]|uniref:uncharacterized protein n=1 Tax=Rhizomucor pusillus TaxID=4840 RepID=UPI0037444154
MADTNSEGSPFDFKTTQSRFQKKLLEAQRHAAERQIELDLYDQDTAQESLESQKHALKAEVDVLEKKVESLRKELELRKRKRQEEARLSKLTPEERARIVEQEEEDEKEREEGKQEDQEEDLHDMNVLFEYLVLVGSVPLPKNAADMSGSDFVLPHVELRAKAMENPEVLEQSEFCHIRITEAINQPISLPDGSTRRNCKLTGASYGQPFTITFDVLQPSLVIDKFDYDVNFDMQLEIGPLLQNVKEERNLLYFFRLVIHYSRLCNERRRVFDRLQEVFRDRSVEIKEKDANSLIFKNESGSGVELTLSWSMVLKNEIPCVNICEQVTPDVRLECNNCGSSNQEADDMESISAAFDGLMRQKGVLLAAQVMISALLGVSLD